MRPACSTANFPIQSYLRYQQNWKSFNLGFIVFALFTKQCVLQRNHHDLALPFCCVAGTFGHTASLCKPKRRKNVVHKGEVMPGDVLSLLE